MDNRKKRYIIGLITAILTVITIAVIFISVKKRHLFEMPGKEDFPFFFENGKVSKEMESGAETLDVGKFSKISIDTCVTEVTFIESQNGKYEVAYDYSGVKGYGFKPSIEVENDKLIITQKISSKVVNGSNYCNITISIPNDEAYGDSIIDIDVGSVEIKNFEFKDLEIIADVGDVNVEKVVAKKAKLEANVGNVTVNKCRFLDLTANSDVGNVKISNTETEYVSGSSGVGDIELTNVTNNGKEPKTDFSADIGDIDIDGKNYEHSYKN